MNYGWNLRRSSQGIGLLLGLWCCGGMSSWTAGATQPRAVSVPPAATQPARPVLTQPRTAAPTDPCAPATAMPETKTKAATEPSRRAASALVGLTARARGQEGTSSPEPQHRGAAAQQLWSSRITAPHASDDAEASLALQRLIRQVHSLTTTDRKPVQPPEPAVTPAPVAPTTAATPVETKPVEPAPMEAVATAAPAATTGLSAKAQKTLDDLRKSPERVQDPLEAAELLFLSGRPTDATPFYEEALRRTRAGDAACAGDRAWILFQLGNCLRETDTAKAQEAYVKLIAEYPDSPWTEMARAGGRYLTWYQSTRPDQLMRVHRP